MTIEANDATDLEGGYLGLTGYPQIIQNIRDTLMTRTGYQLRLGPKVPMA